MSVQSESAEQVMKMVLEGEQICLKATGKAAIEVSKYICKALKNPKPTKGKARLTKLIKSGYALDIFTIQKEDLKKFVQEAKRYGVLYSAIVDKKNESGKIDLLVRKEDSSRVNRIVQRFNIASVVDEGELKTEIIRTKESKAKTPEEKQKGVEQKDIEVKEQEKQELVPIQKEEIPVPLVGKQTKENQLENSSKILRKQEGNTKMEKKSVRQELKEIKEEIAKKEQLSSKVKDLSKTKTPKHKHKDRSK